MSTPHVIVVHLRRPRRNDPNERRSDPFYEFGSFGCTKCHARNIMHPGRAHELDGVRFAFAQGGPLGFRLVHLTPPARVVIHADRCELLWTPAEPPFRYDTAPLLVDAGGNSDFPALAALFRRVSRRTWPARFSSAFRSRRAPLPATVAEELIRVFDDRRMTAKPEALAATYVDALPYPPNNPDMDRGTTLTALRAGNKNAPGMLPEAIVLKVPPEGLEPSTR
ncbi:MAG: hypothetical protein IT442_10120 [Phycisphaeraceae bacterium]|nr:hypothetical protein [Phycisphaeraceae bacterium]